MHVSFRECSLRAGCVVYRDGTVYGCGSTEHGQLPYLRYSQDGSADSLQEASMSAAELENVPARNEITIPTQLRLPVRQACLPSNATVSQVRRPMHSQGSEYICICAE